ncbi:SDR family NAD(P)-dependent oxidoreductase [Methylocapsa sp. S129]|uniref:SDR family NAD(P)-dependent oxidoreductase n=1 Tax=Methylocapsa sp. S129 TaxID=1641869 RepID=UPI00131B368C|nr:SDR family oxidoreductase [Methylocapsa sp. S129]
MTIAIITGSSRGIGKAAALECAKRGIGIIATYNSHKPGADELVHAIESQGGKAVALSLDVGKAETFAAFAERVGETLASYWGRTNFDFLVNNAGFGAFNRIEDVTSDAFDRLMAVHLKGPFFLTQALLPRMKDGGAIVNLSSATVRVATAGVAPYAAFKGGIEALTRYMAKEFGERRIRVNAVAPGAIRTDLADGALDKNPEFAALLASQTALGRVGEPEDVGRVIASLLSEESGWINAQTIEVAGGYMI